VRILAVLAVAAPLWAQAVTAGLRAGAVVSPTLAGPAIQTAPASRITAGPFFELHLSRAVGVGIDCLFRRPGLNLPPSGSRLSFWQMELPVSFFYRFRTRPNLVVRTGLSLNRLFEIGGPAACERGPFGEQFYCLNGAPVAELRHAWTSGVVAGAGIGWNVNRFRIEPEVRFTHSFDRNFGVRDSVVRSSLDELALLVGVTF
jgi:hypothetical protein